MNTFTQRLVRDLEAQERERITAHWLAALKHDLGEDHPLAQAGALSENALADIRRLARDNVQRWRLEGMEAEAAALRTELTSLRKQVKRKPKQHARAGQVREAVDELAAVHVKPTRRAVATWIGIDPSALSKKPLKAAYTDAIAKARRKSAEGRARVKGWHET